MGLKSKQNRITRQQRWSKIKEVGQVTRCLPDTKMSQDYYIKHALARRDSTRVNRGLEYGKQLTMVSINKLYIKM